MAPEQVPTHGARRTSEGTSDAAPHGAGPVRHLLVALVSTVCRFPRVVLALSLALCTLSVYAAATRLEYHTQRNDLVSPHKDYQQRWRRYLAEFGDDDDIVVVVRGHHPGQMQQALEALADRIRAQPELFDRLFYKVDLRPLLNRALLFLPTSDIRTIQENLRGMGPLLQYGPLMWRGLTLLTLLQEANLRVSDMEPGKPLRPVDDQFLGQLGSITRAARAMLVDPRSYRDPWGDLVPLQGGGGRASRPAEDQKKLLAEPQYFFSGDPTAPHHGERLAFLLTRPVKEPGSFTAALKSVRAMRDIVAGLKPAFPEVEFGLTGMPVLETDEMAAAEKDTHLASWLAIAGVTLLFFVVYRGVYYPLLTIATLLTGTAWAMGWLTLTVGHLNILSATFAVMLIGMGDYGVLWVMRYEQARGRGFDVRSALLHTTTHVAVGNLTAAATLALAFFAAMLADFQAVAELGWIAGCGVLLCALACFTMLPALLMLLDRRPAGEGNVLLSFRAARDTWLPALGRHPRWVVAGGLTVAAALAACTLRISYDHNLLHLQARDLESVKWEMILIEHTAGASWHALTIARTPEEALALKARYEEMPEVSRVVEVASLVPADQDRKLALLRDIQERLSRLPERHVPIPHVRPVRQDLLEEVARLVDRLGPLASSASAVSSGSSGKPLQGGLCDDLRAFHRQLAGMPVALTAEERLQDFEQRLAGDLAEKLHQLRDVSTPAPITLADLPPELRERYVGRSGHWLLRVFARDSLWDFGPLEEFTKKIRAVDPEATGKPFGTVEGLKAMKNGLTRAGFYAFAVIVVVLLIDFRSVKHALIALTPLVLGVALSVGVLGLFGVPLNPANMIAFPLILGVGVDNGVHVLHDYLIRRSEGRSGISHAIGRGVLVKALTTMIGFGTLMISTERGLIGLGLILTLGVGCSMLSALVLLPAVFELRLRKAAPREIEAPPEPVRLAA